jgi:hypothetical protein
MGRAKQKHVGKRRKPNRRQPELGEYGQFSIQRLQRSLAAESESKSAADGAVDLETGAESEEHVGPERG